MTKPLSVEQVEAMLAEITQGEWKQVCGSDISAVVNGQSEALCRVFAQPLKASKGQGISTATAAKNAVFIATAPAIARAYLEVVKQRDELVATLETRAEEEVKMLAEVAAENDELRESLRLKTAFLNSASSEIKQLVAERDTLAGEVERLRDSNKVLWQSVDNLSTRELMVAGKLQEARTQLSAAEEKVAELSKGITNLYTENGNS